MKNKGKDIRDLRDTIKKSYICAIEVQVGQGEGRNTIFEEITKIVYKLIKDINPCIQKLYE